jgi:hypothetical protein
MVDGGQCGADLLIGCCFLEAKELEVFGDDSACRVLLVAMEILGVDGWWRWP